MHPRHPFDRYGNDGRRIIVSASLTRDGVRSQPIPNIKMSIEVLGMGNILPDSNSVPVRVKLRAKWTPALAEIRNFNDDDPVCQQFNMVLRVQHAEGV